MDLGVVLNCFLSSFRPWRMLSGNVSLTISVDEVVHHLNRDFHVDRLCLFDVLNVHADRAASKNDPKADRVRKRRIVNPDGLKPC